MTKRPVLVLAISALLGGMIPVVASAQHAEHYVLDGFGGVHAGDGAPVIAPATPYFGWDAAVDMEYVPVGTDNATGDGILVLDMYGGVHYGGALASDQPGGGTPYFGFDAARAIVYRDIPPRVASAFEAGTILMDQSSYVAVASTSVHAPDDGYLLINGSANFICVAGIAGVAISLALDGTTPPSGLEFLARDPSCQLEEDPRIVAVTYLFPVTAGNHTVNLVGRLYTGMFNPEAYLGSRSITVLYVDKDKFGES